MKTKNLVTLTLVICLLTTFTACQKVADIQPDKPVLPGLNVTESNWGFQLPDSSFAGTVDTAYTASSEGVNNIVIRGSDTAGNVISILLSTKEKTFIKDAYTSLYGRAFISFQTDTFYYASYKDSGSFTFEITKITDSVIEGNYKAVLLDKASHKIITIKSGTVKANFHHKAASGNEDGNEESPQPVAYYWKANETVFSDDITTNTSDNSSNIWSALSIESQFQLNLEFSPGNLIKDGIYDIADHSVDNLKINQIRLYFYFGTLKYFMAKSGNVTVITNDGVKTASFSDILFEEQNVQPLATPRTTNISGLIKLQE